MGEPGGPPRPVLVTPPSRRLKRLGGEVVTSVGDLDESPRPVPTPASGGDRRIRRRGSNSGSESFLSGENIVHESTFLVYLPNATCVDVRVDGASLKNLTVKTFVELVRKCNEQTPRQDTMAKRKQREVEWSRGVHVQDFEGRVVEDGDFVTLRDENKAGRGLLLYDNNPDTVHSHPGFWDVTPVPQLLANLPQDYTVFSALADELDNSLQAVYQLQGGKTRLICVDLDHLNGKIIIFDTGKGMDGTSENSISKWGTLGASLSRHERSLAIGGQPPYLKPNFGMYGFGGIGAGFHLGGSISVSSKTEVSKRVAVLNLVKDTLENTTSDGRDWKTPGAFRSPTTKELELSPHGSFTKVEISDLKGVIPTWKVADVQRKLKDYYFPYIQNDEGTGGTTSTPVQIRVNGVDLAEVLGGEVAHSNYYSGNGEPYVLILKLSKKKTIPGDNTPFEANARITCRYFPIQQGREAIQEILDKLTEEDPDHMEVDFERFPRRSIRRLGRLLPDSQEEKLLPFMEPKRTLTPKALNKHCYKRVKAFIDVDAGFTPNQTKMDLLPTDLFTKALLTLGRGEHQQSRGPGKWSYSEFGPVTVLIHRNGTVIEEKDLHKDYEKWITLQHHEYDTGPIFEKSDVVIFSSDRHMKELNINDEVFQVVYGIKCRVGSGYIDWKLGKGRAPIHLKLQKGIPGLNNDMVIYVTVECFISGGFAEAPGEARIICRPMGIPEERGSKEIKAAGQDPDFQLGESRAFPIEDILFSNKYEEVDEDVWLKQMEKMREKLPGFVELLSDVEALKLVGQESIGKVSNRKAGAALPAEIIAVVRPKLCKHQEKVRDSPKLDAPRLEQKFIIAEAMEMKLVVVRKLKSHHLEEKFPKRDMDRTQKLFETKISASKDGKLKGLYSFSTTNLESISKTSGSYFLIFSLVSAKHQDVDDFIVRMNITPSSKIGNWSICSHPGDCTEHHKNQSPEVIKFRLGQVRPRVLYLSRVDEFGNSMEFQEIPRDIACSICTADGNARVAVYTTISKGSLKITNDKLNLEIPITVDNGNLAPLKPTMQAVLQMTLAGVKVASFSISVLPGEVSSARMKESSEAPGNHLHPGQIIEQIVFEVRDRCQNPVSAGQKVKVVLEGFALQDKIGVERSVDGNGCLDLGMRLRVTSGYGEAARLELRSTEDFPLLGRTFPIIKRSLRVRNIPHRVPARSQLVGVEIEAVDENGDVDRTMNGKDHTLTLDWNRNIIVPLLQGRCTLQDIPMPQNAGEWEGCVFHTHYPNLKTCIKVNVEKATVEKATVEKATVEKATVEKATVEKATVEKVIVEKVPVKRERVEVNDDSMEAYDMPYDMPASPVAEPHNPVPDIPLTLVMDGMSAAERDSLELLCQSNIEETMKLENQIQRLHPKLIKEINELETLHQMQLQYQESKRQYHANLDSLKKTGSLETSTSKVSGEPESPVSQPYVNRSTVENQLVPSIANDYQGILGSCITIDQVEMQIANLGDPPGTNAATMLLQAKREQHSEISEDIIGIVALLGAVETEELNRALVEFLGLENMLAIICKSKCAAEYMGMPSIDRVLDKSKGLSGFVKSRNLEISGRFRVMTLTDESSFFKRVDGQPAVDDTHPQKLLNLGPITKRPKGSHGYAVNMIKLNEEQLHTRISGGHGLRESLFFRLFGFLEVFDTTENMIRAQKHIRSSAVSLDGGLIRTRNQFELGSREDPVVWFPTWIPPDFRFSSTTRENSVVLPLRSISPMSRVPVQRSLELGNVREVEELQAIWRGIHQRYMEERVGERIKLASEALERTKVESSVAEQQMKEHKQRYESIAMRGRIKDSTQNPNVKSDSHKGIKLEPRS